MFREIRRAKQKLPEKDAVSILERNTFGVLAVYGDDGYPYAVPLNYVYDNGYIYFHSAKSGHKLDAISNNSKASFCVTDKSEIVPDEYTTYFRSAIAFGHARVLKDEKDISDKLLKLALKYSPELPDGCKSEVRKELSHVCMIEFEIEHLSGKEAIELVNAKRNNT